MSWVEDELARVQACIEAQRRFASTEQWKAKLLDQFNREQPPPTRADLLFGLTGIIDASSRAAKP